MLSVIVNATCTQCTISAVSRLQNLSRACFVLSFEYLMFQPVSQQCNCTNTAPSVHAALDVSPDVMKVLVCSRICMFLQHLLTAGLLCRRRRDLSAGLGHGQGVSHGASAQWLSLSPRNQSSVYAHLTAPYDLRMCLVRP